MQNVVTNASVKSPIEPNTLHFVSDNELLLRTKELARSETEFTIVTIQHLDEIERRGLYDKRGYPSLFEYAVRELHYSKGSTWRRIMVMKLCRAVPGIADKLRSGELNLTTASQLQNAIEKRARKAARERASASVSVPPAGAVSGAAGEPVSGEVQPARTRAAGVAGVEAAASGAVWAAVGEAATQAAAGQSAAGKSAAAVPLPAGAAAAAGVTPAAAPLAPAQAETVGVGPAAAVPVEPVTWPRDTAAARAAGNAAVAAPPAPAPASAVASPTAGAARESAALPPVAEPPPAWTLDQTVELVNLVANKSARETEKLLAELEPELALPRERQRALGGGRYEVRVILDQGSVDTIAKLKGLLSHVNPGFTTGQLLAYLLQQAERKYDPLRERGRAQRGAAAPARHAERCEQHRVVCNERRATGSALSAGVSQVGSSTCPTGALGEGMPVTKAARGSIAAGAVAALAPALGSAAAAVPASAPAAAGLAAARVRAPGSAATGPSGALTGGSAQNQRAPTVPSRRADRTPQHAAGWADAGFPASAPHATGPSGALAGGSAQNQRASAVRHRADRTPQHAAGLADAGFPASALHAASSSGALADGSAQNQRAPLVPGRSGGQTLYHAADSAEAAFPTLASAAGGPSVALAGGSAQNQRAPRIPAPDSEQDRRDSPGSAQNQLAPRAGNVRSRADTEAHRGGRARLPEGGTAARPPAPESSRARRARRHIPAAVRRAVWRRDGGTCCYQDPLTGVTCGSTHLLQIDHIVPVAQGGRDDIANLRLLCAVHNRRRDPRCASYRSAAAAAGGRSR